MRKVTRQIAEAFKNHKSLTVGNTMTDGETVWLHGNAIVKRINGHIYWSLAGWNTVTTRERINGIVFDGLCAGVCQRNFDPVYRTFRDGITSETPISSSKWYMRVI